MTATDASVCTNDAVACGTICSFLAIDDFTPQCHWSGGFDVF
jgi:hypothetical protein